MYPRGNQPGKLYRTTKTHEFNNIQENNKEKLKLCSIIDQTETQLQSSTRHFAVLRTNFFPPDIKNMLHFQHLQEGKEYCNKRDN